MCDRIKLTIMYLLKFLACFNDFCRSAVLQPHIGVSVAGRISPASSSTSPPPAGTSVQHRTSLIGVTTENPHVFHPISTQGIIYTNSPITLCGRVPSTSTSPVSPAHPAVLEWAHSIAVSAPLQRLQRPVSSVGAFSPALYKSEVLRIINYLYF